MIVPPAQRLLGLAVAVALAAGFTTTLPVTAVAVQPAAFVTLKVYAPAKAVLVTLTGGVALEAVKPLGPLQL